MVEPEGEIRSGTANEPSSFTGSWIPSFVIMLLINETGWVETDCEVRSIWDIKFCNFMLPATKEKTSASRIGNSFILAPFLWILTPLGIIGYTNDWAKSWQNPEIYPLYKMTIKLLDLRALDV